MNEQTNQQTDLANQWITKQAAIDALTEVESHYEFEDGHDHLMRWAKTKIFALPSAQPIQNNTSNALSSLDCVDRQAAIDGKITAVISGQAIEVIPVSYIKKLPSAQRWISVTEAMPDEHNRVLILTDDGTIFIGDHNEYWEDDYEFEIDDVTAWMPLPKPWEGEKK